MSKKTPIPKGINLDKIFGDLDKSNVPGSLEHKWDYWSFGILLDETPKKKKQPLKKNRSQK